MRFLRTMIAAAVLAAPLVTLTVPPTAWAAADDSSKDDAQILKDAQGKLKNKKFSGVQVAVQNGMVTLTRAQLSMMLEGIDWRRPIRTQVPERSV